MSIKIDKLIIYMLPVFLTLSIMNGLHLDYLRDFAQYGKILFIFFAVIFLLLYKYYIRKKKAISTISSLLISIVSLFSIFSFKYYFTAGNELIFFNLIVFIMYMLFLFLLSEQLVRIYSKRNDQYITNKSSILVNVFQSYQVTIVVNIVIWMILAYALGVQMTSVDEVGRSGFGGFYGDRMAFGLLCASAYLVTFFLFQHSKKITNRLYHFILLTIFLSFIIFSDSRTSLLITLTATIYFYFKKYIPNANSLVLISCIFIASYLALTINFANANYFTTINESTSGRTFIWNLVINEIIKQNLLEGYGLLNLNNIILTKYTFSSYYFQKIDFLYFHSSYLEILASGGLLSLILFIIMIIKIYSTSEIWTRSIILGGLFGALFESYLILPAIPISNLFWLSIFVSSFIQYQAKANT